MVHPDQAIPDLVQAALDGIQSRHLKLSVLHTSSIADALARAQNMHQPIVAALVAMPQEGDPFAAIAALRRGLKTLFSLVLLADERVRTGNPLISPDGEIYPVLLSPHRESPGFGQFIDEVIRHLITLRFLVESLRDLGSQFHFLTSAGSQHEHRQAARLLLNQMSRLLGVNVRLIEDVNAASFEISTTAAPDAEFLAFVSEAGLAEHLRLQATSHSADEIVLGDFLVKERLVNVRPQGQSATFVTDFKPILHERRPFWVGLAYGLDGSVVSCLGVVPSFNEGPFVEVRLAVLHLFFEAWVTSFENVFMQELARRDDEQRAQNFRVRQEAIQQMVCGLAHELNTPLGVINMAAGLIENAMSDGRLEGLAASDATRELGGDLAQAGRMIRTNVFRLGELVERFKSISATQAFDELGMVSVAEVVDEAIKTHRAQNRGKPLTVHTLYDLDPGTEQWRGYARQLSQVVFNLLQNVEQHAYKGEGGLVEISARGRLMSGIPAYSMRVTDYGLGIAKLDLPKIFDPFFTTAREVKGAGLGLAVVHSLVTESLRGTIRCESEPSLGTTFFLDFASLPVGKVGSL